MVNIFQDNGFNFRFALEADIDQLIDLFNHNYIRKFNADYFMWQYFNSYYPAVLSCVFQNKLLIGVFGLQKRILNNGIFVGQAIDLLISKDFRGKGLFKELGNRAISFFNDVQLLCVLPNHNGKIAIENNFGWKTIAKINSLELNLDDYKTNKATNELLYCLQKKDITFHYDNKIEYWRFQKHPNYRYHFISNEDQDIIVVKTFYNQLNKIKYGDLVLIKHLSNNNSSLVEVIINSIKFLLKLNVRRINTWALKHTLLYRILLSMNFIECPQERYFCVRTLVPKINYLENIENWQIFQADAEFY
jgi:hypothetical protein